MLKSKKIIAVWFSCGAASAVAAKKTIERYGDQYEIIIINNPIKEEHPDNLRFLTDVENWLGIKIIKAGNPDFTNNSIVEVFEQRKYMSGTRGAPCTMLLKKGARYAFELKNDIAFHVLGFTKDEKKRHDSFIKFERANVLPVLIEEGLTKKDCFEILTKAGLELPEIYSPGYPNANCIGCVKSQSPTYWNLVRRTFPEVFKQRSEQSRRIGARLCVLKGKRIFLDELPEDAKGGRIKSYECGIFCETLKQKKK